MNDRPGDDHPQTKLNDQKTVYRALPSAEENARPHCDRPRPQRVVQAHDDRRTTPLEQPSGRQPSDGRRSSTYARKTPSQPSEGLAQWFDASTENRRRGFNSQRCHLSPAAPHRRSSGPVSRSNRRTVDHWTGSQAAPWRFPTPSQRTVSDDPGRDATSTAPCAATVPAIRANRAPRDGRPTPGGARHPNRGPRDDRQTSAGARPLDGCLEDAEQRLAGTGQSQERREGGGVQLPPGRRASASHAHCRIPQEPARPLGA